MMNICFRDDLEDVLTAWVAHARGLAEAGDTARCYDVLASPHSMSPFLTLAEWPDAEREGLPRHVVKLLVVPPEDPTGSFWRETLERERQRWARELDERQRLPSRVAALGLPLAGEITQWVRIGEAGPFFGPEILAQGTESTSGRFYLPFMVRPYIAWPRIAELGFSNEQLTERWDVYCEENGVQDHLREPLFHHFCDEALTNERRDVLLTSAWRLEMFR